MQIDLSAPLPKPHRRSPAKHWQWAWDNRVWDNKTLCNSKAKTPVIADELKDVTCKKCLASADMPDKFRQVRSYQTSGNTGRYIWISAGPMVALVEALLTADPTTIDRVARVLRRAVVGQNQNK
jgi:hypothetical protein